MRGDARTPPPNLSPAIRFDDSRRVIASSPYRITWPDLAARFATTPHRRRLADALTRWVKEANRLVLVEFVWIGGSFVTDAKVPRDLDCVLFYRYRYQIGVPALRDAFLQQHAGILTRDGVKAGFGIDAALIPLSIPVEQLIHMTAYWAMVFSNSENRRRRAFYSVPARSILDLPGAHCEATSSATSTLQGTIRP